MERYLTQLAAIYEKNWVHNDALYDTSAAPFVWIHAGAPLPLRYATRAKQYPGLTGALAGQLDIEQRADAEPLEGNPLFGFHSQVLEGYAYSSEELLEDDQLGASAITPVPMRRGLEWGECWNQIWMRRMITMRTTIRTMKMTFEAVGRAGSCI
jgi:hypothetical protein